MGGDNARHPLETETAPPAIEADAGFDVFEWKTREAPKAPGGEAKKADDGFGLDDTVSMGMDFLPFIGSGKSIAQLISGTDLITGEPTPRWIEAVGILAGVFGAAGIAKGILKGGSSVLKHGDEVADVAKIVKKSDKANDAARAVKRADKVSDVKGVKSVDDIPDHTYRGDSRSPDEIFDKGFEPRAKGSDTSLEDYARNNTPSDYVGTSKNRDVAQDFADGDGYVYTVKPDKGVDVNKELGNRSPFPNEQEVVIPGGVKPGDIKGATPVNKDGSLGNSTVLNPNHYKKPK